ncbi:hypothetical protein [Yersinia phage fPS-19]|uniref:Uncharacterized protein n=10 Tax=Helsettvirus fPS9 TaxID=2733625 RepID=A0A2D0PEP6_9CAUD|nr:hypothetical protein HOS88_gp01 [Yersinia phage fPS-9]SOO46383.1 hypothetical protein [Yersinia phage fPS-19]SOO46434.1 hypothetical protein [Yersinia phage fPS-26]SOO46485.1 hypothetical protein [Yersinia phage fPS-7]SOO46637.1 hypothetical protein [Yersinia phage fPS-86]SOO46688.1 hypothetical protein [Yersinia phage fPS-50]SOO46738.1 hypothetical protein [Yersinia phage fPS-21]SOO46836.1 hypothetical protein [Yersinia phage fPS-64]SOR54290.1 hypothetical protein [Yersinia phage fPS-10
MERNAKAYYDLVAHAVQRFNERIQCNVHLTQEHNVITYGLTQYTLQTYRGFLGYGMTHERAMESLKRLYKHNKDTYVSPASAERSQAH